MNFSVIEMNLFRGDTNQGWEHYLYSSARDYAGMKGLFNIEYVE